MKPVETPIGKHEGKAVAPQGRLFRKYFLLVLALVCGALVISGATSLYFSYQENKAALAALQREKALGAATHIEQFVRRVAQQLAFAAPPLGSESVAQRRLELLKVLRLAKEVTDISQIGADGREQLSESRLAMSTVGSDKDRSQEPAFRNPRPGKPWFGPVYFRKETEPYITVAVRSGGAKGPVTVAEVNLKFIWDVVTRIKVGDKGKAYVVDGKGYLIADPDIGLVLRKTDLSGLEQVKAALAEAGDARSMLARDPRGKPVLTAWAPIDPREEKEAGGDPLGWKVFVEQPSSEVFRALDASIVRNVALIVAGLLFSALAALWLARSMARPIAVLQEGAQRIGAGELDHPIEVHTGDELEALAAQFNRMTEQLRESYAGLERKVEERTAQLQQTLERQTATAEILEVMSRSQNDLQPMFDTIAANGKRLCGGDQCVVGIVKGELIHIVSIKAMTVAEEESTRAAWPRSPGRGSILARAVLTRSVCQVADVLEDLEYELTETARAVGWRSVVGVPMLRAGNPIGAIAVLRRSPVPYSDDQIALLKTFADQAVIAIENVRLFNETKEALEHQKAISEVLQVISSSPADVQPVLKAVAERASVLCNAKFAGVHFREGELLRGAAAWERDQGSIPIPDVPVKRTFITGRAVLDRRTIQAEDMLAAVETEYPDARDNQRRLGFRTFASVPMLREGAAVGTISLWRDEVRPFRPEEIKLLETFAAQAVIAIENVRLFNETKEALEQQTATSEILKVISRSTSDTQPVFDAIVESGLRLFPGAAVAVSRPHGGQVHAAAIADADPENREQWKARFPFPLSREYVHALAMIDRRIIDVPDAAANTDAGIATGVANFLKSGYRAMTVVPMVRGDVAIGAISVVRRQPGALSEKQLALLRTFADQAVIAIENVRLFNETREALEQQTATSQILEVISRSTNDTQPVFEAIVRSGLNLFPEAAVAVSLPEGDKVRLAAAAHRDGARAEEWKRLFPIPLTRDYINSLAILERRLIDVPDGEANTDPAIAPGVANLLGSAYRAITVTPMLRGGEAIGAISVLRRQPGPLSDKQIALLRTFADQAVIAIENVRLFKETKESLEQQTAIGEVLRVISSTPTDVKPTLDAVAERATRLCDAMAAGVYVLEGDLLRRAAFYGPAALQGTETLPYKPETLAGRVVLEGKAIHVHDIARERENFPVSWEIAQRYGRHTMLAVPLMREGKPFGAMFLRRNEVRPFSEKQMALATTFADQAAIAIENVRLFNETKEALEQQKASGEVLGAISSSIADTRPVFDKILKSCQRLFEGNLVGVTLAVGDKVELAAYQGADRDYLARIYPLPLTRESGTGWAILNASVAHFADIEAAGVPPGVVAGCRALGVRAIVFAPMLFEGKGIGAIWVARGMAGGFTDTQIALLKTFADQAVIAIQNARLFREIQEKSAQLEIANKHKSDFLANMSHELRTPLNAIIGFSEVLMDRMFGELNEKQADYLKDIHESGKHLLSLINDILDLSKIEAGRMELELAPFDLPSTLANAMTLVRERAQRHGIALGLDVDERLGEFRADERKVKQILLNLLSNAVKFTPDGGRIEVRAAMDTDKVEIAVCDTGIGIAPEDQAAVFDEFKQVGRDYTRKAEGTGLGLALTKRFVELHGGEIRLESAPGQGSTFTFTLPVHL